MKTLNLLILTFFLSTACTHNPKVTTESTSSGLEITNYKDKVYFSGQPKSEDFSELSKMGITTVINLRSPKEMKNVNFSEEDTAKKAGITYYNIPVEGAKEFSKTAVQEIETTFMKHHKKEKILIHCASGTRAKSWFAIHVAETHKTSADHGIEKARKLGLKNELWENKVRTYLQQ